ncbi:MAG: YfiR family protein [Gallionella sp.]
MRFNLRLAIQMLVCCSLQPAFADHDIVADENAAEAAALYNFALLTEWPVLPAGEFRICVLGSDPMLAALDPVKKQHLKGHPVTNTNISTATQVQSCQVLFVGRSEHASIGNLARQIGHAPVMVVSEGNDFDPKNVIVLLVNQEGRIAFKINRTAAQANSLAVSSKLLKLALPIY